MLTPEPGAYAPIAVCTPSECMDALAQALNTPEADGLRRRMRRYSRATILAVAKQYAAAADFNTGRGVAVSHATVGAAVGRAPGTVKKICQFLARLGFIVEVARGRNRLNLEELELARRRGGKNQRAVASVRALTIPRKYRCTPLPSTKPVVLSSSVFNSPTKRAKARKSPATRAPLRKNDVPRSLTLQQFAARLVDGDERAERHSQRRLRWLLNTTGKPVHIGALVDVLTDAGIDVHWWTPTDLVAEIDRWSLANSRTALGTNARHPLRYFRWLLSQAIPPGTLSPAERRAAAQLERDVERRRQDAQREADRKRMAAVDHDEVARIIAQMHDERNRRPRRLPDRTPFLPQK